MRILVVNANTSQIVTEKVAAQARASVDRVAVTLPPVAGGVRPSVIPRSGWGANESYRYSGGEEIGASCGRLA